MVKKKRKKKITPKVGKFYDNGELKKKACPKCGSGVFMASHKDRDYCGKCHYMEKKSVPKPEAKKEASETKVSERAQKAELSDKPKKEVKPKK
jgi:small subunit ribosomal protein S27Ae